MNDLNSTALSEQGFRGFVPVSDLQENSLQIPSIMGIYTVLRTSATPPNFLERSPASWFKSKDPTVPVSRLTDEWVPGAEVLYIGSGDSLRDRVGLLIEFSDAGRSKSVFHWGGRLLWQLADSENLVVAWKATPQGIGREERDLVLEFKEAFEMLPFANLKLPPVRA